MNGNQHGFVLIVVLWVLAILTIITVGFGHRAVLDQKVAAYSLDHAQALILARSAVQRGIVSMRNKAIKDMAMSQMSQGSGHSEPPMTHYGQEWAKPQDLLEEGEEFFDSERFAEGDSVRVFIEDENSRLNINAASLKLIEEVEALDRRVKRRIRVRRTTGLREEEGRNPFHAIEELRYIRGVDEEDWYGTDDEPGLVDLFTCEGNKLININTASRAVIETIPDLDKKAINAILAYRAGGDGELETGDDQGFSSFVNLTDVTGIVDKNLGVLRQHAMFNSTTFRIRGVATLRRGKIRATVTAVVTIGNGTASIRSWREEPLGT